MLLKLEKKVQSRKIVHNDLKLEKRTIIEKKTREIKLIVVIKKILQDIFHFMGNVWKFRETDFVPFHEFFWLDIMKTLYFPYWTLAGDPIIRKVAKDQLK